MATEPIGSGNSPVVPDGMQKTAAEQAKKAATSDRTSTDSAANPSTQAGNGEKVQISREAEELLRMRELMSDARRKLEQTPEVRTERIQEVRERLEAGVYDTRAIRDELAYRLTNILGDLPVGEDGDSTL